MRRFLLQRGRFGFTQRRTRQGLQVLVRQMSRRLPTPTTIWPSHGGNHALNFLIVTTPTPFFSSFVCFLLFICINGLYFIVTGPGPRKEPVRSVRRGVFPFQTVGSTFGQVSRPHFTTAQQHVSFISISRWETDCQQPEVILLVRNVDDDVTWID